jgi:hypothetical protein
MQAPQSVFHLQLYRFFSALSHGVCLVNIFFVRVNDEPRPVIESLNQLFIDHWAVLKLQLQIFKENLLINQAAFLV